MEDKSFQEKLAELVTDLNRLPDADREKISDLASRARNRQDKMKKTIGELSESLDYLRLSVKYLVFDLEATRRENSHLKQMIAKLTNNGNTPENNE